MDDQQTAEREIVEIHELFEEWFTGRCPRTEEVFEERLMCRLHEELVYVMPGGTQLSREDLRSGIWDGHGSNTDFRIAIRNVRVRLSNATTLVAFYEEWQKGAKASQPSNARLSTVVWVRDGERLLWTHLHETWMAPDAIAAADFDF